MHYGFMDRVNTFGTVFYIRSPVRGVRIIYRCRPRKTREYSLVRVSHGGFIPRVHCTGFGTDSWNVRLFSGIDRLNDFGLIQTEREKNCCTYFFDYSNTFCGIYFQYESVLHLIDGITIVARTTSGFKSDPGWRDSFLFCFSIIFWKYIQTWNIIVRIKVLNTTFVYDARYTLFSKSIATVVDEIIVYNKN